MSDGDFIKKFSYRDYLSIVEGVQTRLAVLKAQKRIKYYSVSKKKKHCFIIKNNDEKVTMGIAEAWRTL